MRHRAPAVLLAVTAGDYLLWKWSLAGSHDVLALASGMTLLPLGVVSLARVALAASGLVAQVMRACSTMVRSVRAHRNPSTRDPSHAAKGDPSRAATDDPSRAATDDPSRTHDPSDAITGDPSRAAKGDPPQSTTRDPAETAASQPASSAEKLAA